jgi:hypothetical protein
MKKIRRSGFAIGASNSSEIEGSAWRAMKPVAEITALGAWIRNYQHGDCSATNGGKFATCDVSENRPRTTLHSGWKESATMSFHSRKR